jgi:hypothetical protein
MVELWATLTIIFEFIIPGIFVLLSLLFISPFIFNSLKRSIRYDRNIKLLKKYGFERYLWDVSSCGNGAFYAWRKNKKDIKERDLYYYSAKELRDWVRS